MGTHLLTESQKRVVAVNFQFIETDPRGSEISPRTF
jgi:hypothetical protein